MQIVPAICGDLKTFDEYVQTLDPVESSHEEYDFLALDLRVDLVEIIGVGEDPKFSRVDSSRYDLDINTFYIVRSVLSLSFC